MNDEELYLEATKEAESDSRNPALWAKAVAVSEGDQEKAKYQYIKLRVEQLANRVASKGKATHGQPIDEFDINYMPVAEFSEIKSLSETKVVEMIRQGFYVGRVRDGEWYVSRSEGKVAAPTYTTHGSVKRAQKPKATHHKPLIEDRDLSKPHESPTPLSRLMSGEISLPQVYWVYFVLVGVVVSIVGYSIESTGGFLSLLVVYTIYQIPVLIGMWRSSRKYQGPEIWAILARLASIFGWIFLAIGIFSGIGLATL